MIESVLSSLSSVIDPSQPWVYLIVLLGGVLSSFLPCSLSSLPLIISYVSAGKRDTKSSFLLSLVFAAGMAVTYTFLSLIALALGNIIGTTGHLWYLILAVLMLMMGLQMLGVFNFIPSCYLQTKDQLRGYPGALLAGILSGVFSSPCSTPVLVAVLSIASMADGVLFSALLLLCYSIGYSVLSVIAGTFVGFVTALSSKEAYRKLGQFVQILLGLAILLLSFYLFYQAF